MFRISLVFLFASILVGQPKAGETRRNPIDGQLFVWIPAGDFQMGCVLQPCYPKSRPRHKVQITQGFWVGQTEVTNEAFDIFSATSGDKHDPEHPPGEAREEYHLGGLVKIPAGPHPIWAPKEPATVLWDTAGLLWLGGRPPSHRSGVGVCCPSRRRRAGP